MKKTMSFLLAAVMLLGLLASCAQEPQPTAPQTTTSPSSAPTAAPTTVPTEPPVTAKDIMISEVMPDNKWLCMGHTLDWIELYNGEAEPVVLDGYYLADNTQLAEAMDLSGMEIPAGGYLTVVLREEDPFHLSSQGETVYLAFDREVISQLTYPVTENGESWDENGACANPTPGYENTEEGYARYLETLELPELIISEVLSSNSKFDAPAGGAHDIVEITNISDGPVKLSGYTLSDKRSEPERYAFPDVTLESGQCYVVYCSDDATLGEAHAAFKISASGETVFLAKDGVIVDLLRVPADLLKNKSFGRQGKQTVYFETPTPGKPNTEGFENSLAVPQANLPSGIYAEELTVELSGEGTIYYTLDGSRPTVNSKVYTEPLVLKKVATTVRTFCVSEGRESAMAAYTYIIGAEHELPVLNIAIPQTRLTGTQGVLNNISQDYEYEAVMTLIEDGQEKFSVPFGFRLHGNDSRKGSKQNFQLRFRSKYGVGKLQYKLFDNLEIDEFNSLLLKGGSEDYQYAVMRDELATGIVEGTTSLFVQARKPVVLYLGGQYWGIYYLRERFSADYVASHLNVSPESVDLLESYGGGEQAGSNDEYHALIAYVRNHDMSTDENYAYLCSQVDIQSLMDWYICRSYMGDKDIGNIRRFRSSEADGKWKWMYFDLDWAFWHTADAPLSSIVDRFGAEADLMLAVLDHKDGREAFLRRYAELMDTILNEEYITAYIDSLAADILSEIPADRAKWGRSVSHWESEVERLYAYVRDGKRDNNVLADLKHYFGLSSEEMANYFG